MAGVAVVTSLLEKLSRLWTHHAHFIPGIHEELELLQIDLSVLNEFLLKHDDGEDGATAREVKRQIKEIVYEEDEARALREVKREIKECVYKVEDTIDAYLTRIIDNNFLARVLLTKVLMKELVMRIGQLKEVIGKRFPAEYSSKMKPLLKTGNPQGISGARALMTTLPTIKIDDVVGLDDEEERIISYLMKSSDKLGVITIEGEGGVGKTTLARRVYVNTIIAYEFPVRIWITNFKLDDILRNILRVFTSQDIDCLSHKELSENVVACLEKKKFLLVLDNMEDPHNWELIQNVLSKISDGMGKVLITTRFNGFGWRAEFRVSLDALSRMDGWKLFQLKVFGDLKRCPSELEDIGRTIVNKCWGIPLPIILVGGILMGQLMKSNIPYPMEDVLEVYENVNKDLVGELMYGPSDVLVLAYSRLSDELRRCFLYLGVFPKNYEISAWTLTRLWISEGFVRPMEDHSLEEAATQNLDDLIRMGLVMVDKMNPFGKVKTCRVHDTISDFIMPKAVEQELFQLLHGRQTLQLMKRPYGSVYVPYQNTCRRLCVHSNVSKNNLLSMRQKIRGVRSFLWFIESTTGLDLHDLSKILGTPRLLRVLDAKSIKFHRLPQQITRLFHLRYVTLSVDIINTIPEPLSELWNLETLVVDTKSRVITMEANIWRLIWLRHLKTNAAIILPSYNEDLSSNIGEDQSLAGENDLQTLTRLSPESCTTDVSERARNLKILGIRGDLEILFGKMFLERFDLLEKLKLIHDVFPKMSSENPLHQLPPPNHFPPNLKWLTLSQTHLVWDIDMPKLAKIKTLEVLKLKDDAFSGVIWRGPTGDCFPSLKFFLIENSNLVIWKPPTKSLPSLTCLVLKNCENLKQIPEAVAENLERLEIEHLGKSAVNSARRIADQKQQAKEREKPDCRFKLYIGHGCY